MKNVRTIEDAYNNRYTESYDDVFHSDAADCADKFRGARSAVKGTADSLLNDIEMLRSDRGDEWAHEAVSDIIGQKNRVDKLTDFVQKDAESLSRFENEVDYSASLFNDNPQSRYGSTYEAAQRAIEDGRSLLSNSALVGMQPESDNYIKGMIDPALAQAYEIYENMQYNKIYKYGHARTYDRNKREKHGHLGKKNQYGVDVDEFLRIAESQLNTKEGHNNANPYGVWYGNPNNAWCAQFVSWCANEANSLNDNESSVYGIPKNQSTSQFIKDYKAMNRFAYGLEYSRNKENAYKPKAGDIIFIQWYESGELNGHTGIVVACDEATGTIYTIEGNAGDNTDGVYYFNKRHLEDTNISGYGMNGGSSYGIIPDLSLNQF